MYKEEVIFMDFMNFLVQCGTIEIPDAVAGLIRTAIFIIQVVVPILLI